MCLFVGTTATTGTTGTITTGSTGTTGTTATTGTTGTTGNSLIEELSNVSLKEPLVPQEMAILEMGTQGLVILELVILVLVTLEIPQAPLEI
jgi:hypothetical protein